MKWGWSLGERTAGIIADDNGERLQEETRQNMTLEK